METGTVDECRTEETFTIWRFTYMWIEIYFFVDTAAAQLKKSDEYIILFAFFDLILFIKI